MLYSSQRNESTRCSFPRLKFRNNDMSKLLLPGPRTASLGALPMSALPANVTQEVLKNLSTVFSERPRLGLQVRFTLCPSAAPPPPRRSAPVAERTASPRGVPLANEATPESCQCRVSAANRPDFSDGISYCQFPTRM